MTKAKLSKLGFKLNIFGMAALAASPFQRTSKRPQQFLALSGKLGRKYANFLYLDTLLLSVFDI